MIKEKIAQIQKGCGKILKVKDDNGNLECGCFSGSYNYKGKWIESDKQYLCPECQAELKGITETRDEILKMIDGHISKARLGYCNINCLKELKEKIK